MNVHFNYVSYDGVQVKSNIHTKPVLTLSTYFPATSSNCPLGKTYLAEMPHVLSNCW